ncbi:MAG: iron ABC transporter permease [Chthonomonas sp.]|nr:iron ABC transporter permease [Chthonomonas sp.]
MTRAAKLNGELLLILLTATLLHLAAGSTMWIAPWNLWQPDHAAIGALRLPRVLTCVTGGFALGLSGAIFQAVFRNPIAEPYLLGVSGGAAIGGSVAALTGVFTLLGGLAGPLAAMATGLLTLPLVLVLGGRGRASAERLLIGGVVIGSLLAALNTVILLLAGADSNQVLRWLLGTASNTTLIHVAFLAALIGLGLMALRPRLDGLHLLMISSESAQTLGVSPRRLIRESLWIGTALTAAVAGIMGLVGFIGLVSPHIARLLQGQSPAKSAVSAGLVGGILLVLADLASQRLGELPVGAVTAVIGAPALLWLLRR